ncbi:hypothetical protein PUNSTDRAFT_121223 [Punctularia strigosozonata HHB-11173 SS5]|uniref:uncharacterized protein n=1 Tax=Punctularia strigosozonata (strain HHB-11173) TaxID=741275 RepID=UPI0004416415|nr:uncharacterized protein PUNSTDRAFT_121223 [Punctularia strigosozonata HHB-11173 SS5]EIN06941.1 hypothetical protein PUNSTDRAFT_121223 [Punctularia strigosozonata HHB-11173 SS5]
MFWRDHYDWLKEKGYELRSRFSPNWVPSWWGTNEYWKSKEDAQMSPRTYLADATRLSDGAHVVIKLIYQPDHPHEVSMSRLIGMGPTACDYCVPVYDVLHVPEEEDSYLLVMPILRDFDDPPFDTVGEALECIRQIFRGLLSMHEKHIAHRDCHGRNIMLDPRPMYPDSFNFANPQRRRDYSAPLEHLYTRTQRPTRYYLIDFGNAKLYDPSMGPPLDVPFQGGDKTLPEFNDYVGPSNPFAADVYYIGNWVRQSFMDRYRGFGFLKPLVDRMVRRRPDDRPSIHQAVAHLDDILSEIPTRRLRSRVILKWEVPLFALGTIYHHWRRRITFMRLHVPALPRVEESHASNKPSSITPEAIPLPPSPPASQSSRPTSPS